MIFHSTSINACVIRFLRDIGALWSLCRHTYTVMFVAKKIAVILRDDIYQTLKEKAGAQNISSQVNKIFIEYFSKTESMFGTMKKTDLADLRDHKDRCL